MVQNDIQGCIPKILKSIPSSVLSPLFLHDPETEKTQKLKKLDKNKQMYLDVMCACVKSSPSLLQRSL